VKVLFKRAPSDSCACGSGKKFNRCHGSNVTHLPILKETSSLDPCLYALVMRVTSLLSDVIKTVDVDHAERDDLMRKLCLLHFAKKMLRITTAGVTLIRFRQTRQAVTMKRDQHYAWVAFFYYLVFPRQSILFTASLPLKQRDSGRTYIEFKPDDNVFRAALREKERVASKIIEEYPDLRQKGKQKQKGESEYRDWSEPSERNMLKAVWQYFENPGQYELPEDERIQSDRTRSLIQFLHGDLPSMQMHANPYALLEDFDAPGEWPETEGSEDPNSYLFTYTQYPFDLTERLAKFTQAKGFRHKLLTCEKAIDVYRRYFDENQAS
jgi:hypothetical protein